MSTPMIRAGSPKRFARTAGMGTFIFFGGFQVEATVIVRGAFITVVVAAASMLNLLFLTARGVALDSSRVAAM